MTIRHVCAAIVTVAASLAFFVQPAEAQRTTGACIKACDRLPLSKKQADCCVATCFCQYPPDYMSPKEKSDSCAGMDVLCR
jgi:hypothetical protein